MNTTLITIFILILFSCTNSISENLGISEKQTENNENMKGSESNPSNFDTTQLEKTAEMLDENLFWSIIDKSLVNTKSQDSQEEFLIREIGKLTPKQMIGFRLRTDKLLYDTYNSEMWCAGYIMNGGCSDDGFEYFRNWVISRGKDTYYNAKQNPDNLISEVDENTEMYEFESFWYVALQAFEQKTGKDLYDHIDEDSFRTKEGNYPKFEFTWQEEDPQSMKKVCPKLFERLWDN